MAQITIDVGKEPLNLITAALEQASAVLEDETSYTIQILNSHPLYLSELEAAPAEKPGRGWIRIMPSDNPDDWYPHEVDVDKPAYVWFDHTEGSIVLDEIAE